MLKAEEMRQCQMTNCGYIYNPIRGDKKGKIPPGTRFEDLPDDWKCPCCGSSKSMFENYHAIKTSEPYSPVMADNRDGS